MKKNAMGVQGEKSRGVGGNKQFEEIESLKAKLSAAQKENEKLKGGMFGMSSFLFFV